MAPNKSSEQTYVVIGTITKRARFAVSANSPEEAMDKVRGGEWDSVEPGKTFDWEVERAEESV